MFLSTPVSACWCKQEGRFCGDLLEQCLPYIVYQCERGGVEPREVENCLSTGCTNSSGTASCWQKVTASLTVN
ncbi:hypothetical protein TYRP_007147 [Tyrophagus putrescentiae]|nr:hypothetical protein TYRP_007147 [Tyrophagus putrescentiae]